MAPEPDDIVVDGRDGLTVRWRDGTVNRVPAEPLRAACPCAMCNGLRQRGQAIEAAGVAAQDAELVGNWGLSITWSDGHSTGIYSWELLHSLGEA